MEAEFSRIEIMSSMGKVADFIHKLGKEETVKKLTGLGVTGVTIFNNVIGCGVQNGQAEYAYELLPKSVVTIICETKMVDELIEFLKVELYTGHIGDGKIFVSDIRNIIRVRTGEEGVDALNISAND